MERFKIGDHVMVIDDHDNYVKHIEGSVGVVSDIYDDEKVIVTFEHDLVDDPIHRNNNPTKNSRIFFDNELVYSKEHKVLEILRNYENHKTRTTPKDQGNH